MSHSPAATSITGIKTLNYCPFPSAIHKKTVPLARPRSPGEWGWALRGRVVVRCPQGALFIIRVSFISSAIHLWPCVTVWVTGAPRPYVLDHMPCLSCGGYCCILRGTGLGVGLITLSGGQLHEMVLSMRAPLAVRLSVEGAKGSYKGHVGAAWDLPWYTGDG